MKSQKSAISAIVCLLIFLSCLHAQGPQPREQWGAPLVTVTHTGNNWIIAGKQNRVTLNQSNLAIDVQAGPIAWRMSPSLKDDMLIKSRGEEFYERLADAGKIQIEPYDTGFKTGVKITLEQFQHQGQIKGGAPLDLRLFLTVCLQGQSEDLVFDVSAAENETILRQLDWPKQLDSEEAFDYTVLPDQWGSLLPRNWPKAFSTVRSMTKDGKIDPTDTSVVESGNIECWSMSWWGFEKGEAGMMLLVETPDDASYKLQHPAGGPTVMGPRWRATLGKFGYPRSLRMIFFPKGNYVTMAKRYRTYVINTGQFVSLKDKIARQPLVQELIGTPHTRLSSLVNYREGGFRWDPKNPARNFRVTTFDQRVEQLRKLKARGIDRLYVCLTGWPYRGYDRQHPDALPPAPEAGGWDGLKRFNDAMRELKYLFVLHEQYRDYYTDAPSFNEQFAIHEEDIVRPPMVFPSTRFGATKSGYVPYMDHWDGGLMTYLSPRFMFGHLEKNYELMFRHGVHPQGAYLDVFGYIPPDEDFNPEHPTTRADCMKERALCYQWVRHNLGVVGTEAAADWVIPYADFGSANPGRGKAIPVPLYQLVYHDALVIPVGGTLGLLYGGVPSLGGGGEMSDQALATLRRGVNLHAKTALLEMTNHEFLDKNFRKERTTFADGTTVTVDWDANTAEIKPDVR